MAFLPSVDNRPAKTEGSGKYFKPGMGTSEIRILSDAITGYVYWSSNNKPIRSEFHPGTPHDIRMDERAGKPETIKYFWAMIVLDLKDDQIKIWEVTQGTIREQIEALYDNPRWGHPNQYDLSITRSGEKLETSYVVQPNPKEPVNPAVLTRFAEYPVNLQALYSGGNPFESAPTTPAQPRQVSPAAPAQQGSEYISDAQVKAFFKLAREAKFSDAAIRELLSHHGATDDTGKASGRAIGVNDYAEIIEKVKAPGSAEYYAQVAAEGEDIDF
jgi:hypothetical protein